MNASKKVINEQGDVFYYDDRVWKTLFERIEKRQLIEQHKAETKHVLTKEKEIPVEPEKPLEI